MQHYKDYIKRLLEGNKVSIEKHHLTLFEEFLKDQINIEAFNLIQNTQTAMIDRFKEKTIIEDIKRKHVALANGMVGKPYEFIFDFTHADFNEIRDYNLEINEAIGLEFSKSENKISGIPTVAGEHTLVLNFKVKNAIEENVFNRKELILFVNSNPKDLWKEKDSDRTDKYWKEDFASVSAELSSKQLVIASKRGRSHAQEGIFRDDDFSYSFFEDSGWGIIAVADGAGSAKYSRKGSSIACNEIIEYFRNIDREKLKNIEDSVQENLKDATEENQRKLSGYFIEQLGKAAFAAQSRIRDEAATNDAAIKDYSTTIIFALVKKYDSKFVIASFWVGDGGIGIYNKEKNEVTILGTPDSGEFAGQTRFLTMSDIFADGAYANRVRFKIVEDFTALILMTDGITDPKFQTDNNLSRIEKWNELWADLNGANEENFKVDFSKPLKEVEADLLDWLDFWSPGNHDDRTISILY